MREDRRAAAKEKSPLRQSRWVRFTSAVSSRSVMDLSLFHQRGGNSAVNGTRDKSRSVFGNNKTGMPGLMIVIPLSVRLLRCPLLCHRLLKRGNAFSPSLSLSLSVTVKHAV